MKKFLATLALVVALCGSMVFAACFDNAGNNTNGDNGDTTNPGNVSGTGDNDTSQSQTEVSSITSISGFSNGLAFVQFKDDPYTYGIDKTGKRLFKMGNCYVDAGFNGKVAMIVTYSGYDRESALCDKNGNIYKAEDFGASRFVLNTDNHRRAFLDGYIILERREESYTGTKIEMSIMDSDFNTLVPFSVELAEAIDEYLLNVAGTGYYDGYLYWLSSFEDIILDLRTGTILTDRTQVKVSSPLLAFKEPGTVGGTFDYLSGGDIYNAITGEVIAHVEESTISNISFVGNIGLATYHTDNGTWFNIVDQNGTAKFEPIKAEGAVYNSGIEFDEETILTYYNNTAIEELSLKSYDLLGNLLGEIVVKDWPMSGSISFTDGVIVIGSAWKGEYFLYNSALEKLF